MTEENKTLLPCPFCGRAATLMYRDPVDGKLGPNGEKQYLVASCLLDVDDAGHLTGCAISLSAWNEADLAEKWNRRASAPETAQERDDLRGALEQIGRMKLLLDDKMNRTTLFAAITIARTHLEKIGGAS